MTFKTSSEYTDRLERSSLYQRSELRAVHARVMSRLYALWYLNEEFREKYWVDRHARRSNQR